MNDVYKGMLENRLLIFYFFWEELGQWVHIINASSEAVFGLGWGLRGSRGVPFH